MVPLAKLKPDPLQSLTSISPCHPYFEKILAIVIIIQSEMLRRRNHDPGWTILIIHLVYVDVRWGISLKQTIAFIFLHDCNVWCRFQSTLLQSHVWAEGGNWYYLHKGHESMNPIDNEYPSVKCIMLLFYNRRALYFLTRWRKWRYQWCAMCDYSSCQHLILSACFNES